MRYFSLMPKESKFTVSVSPEDHQRLKEAACRARRPLYKWAGEALIKFIKPKQKKG